MTYVTKACFNCNEHSWQAAEGIRCPYCGKREITRERVINWVIIAGSLLAIVGMIYGVTG